jgi:hypothetical protein
LHCRRAPRMRTRWSTLRQPNRSSISASRRCTGSRSSSIPLLEKSASVLPIRQTRLAGSGQFTLSTRGWPSDEPFLRLAFDKRQMGLRRLGTKSSQTLRWREPDSKFQYRAKSTRLASSEMSWRSFGTYRSTSRAVASAQEKRFADSPPEGHGSEPAVSARLPRS